MSFRHCPNLKSLFPGGSPARTTVQLFDDLFACEFPGKRTGNFLDDVNPDSLELVEGAFVDRSLAAARPLDRFQFERLGYFCVDLDSGKDGAGLVFNRTVSLVESKKRKEMGGDDKGKGNE